MPALLRALQGGLEGLYRIETQLDVRDFLLNEARRGALDLDRLAREQLVIKQGEQHLELALFVAEEVLANLERRDPRRQLDDDNLGDFLLAVEGVSHFVYVAHRARADRPVSAAELELQAEVDKYVVALLVGWQQTGQPPPELRRRLFTEVRFAADLSSEERDRYQLANTAADDYAAALELRFVERRAGEDLLAEVRRFYRKGLSEKLDHITRLAA